MLIPRPLLAQCTRLRWSWPAPCHSRHLHGSKKGLSSFRRFRVSQSQKPSLLEELFPEEARKVGNQDDSYVSKVPRLPLPEVDDFSEGFDHDVDRERAQPREATKVAAANAFHQQHLAVLVLGTGSKSLIESDFRRIAPKGQHIGRWTGPGDILKVIPVRDRITLEPAGGYFILFPNPAYARTYQAHVLRLHRIARTHTPTSIESPLPLQPGVVIEGEDAYTLLQDYSLCPPSQKIQLKVLNPSHSASIKQMLDQRGYRPLLGETLKTGTSVLFSVDRQRWPTSVIRDAIAADGRDRGLAWDISIDKLGTPTAADGFDDSATSEIGQLIESGARRHALSRWLISFLDENEARRFIRVWHRRMFPTAQGDDPALVLAEFIW